MGIYFGKSALKSCTVKLPFFAIAFPGKIWDTIANTRAEFLVCFFRDSDNVHKGRVSLLWQIAK